MGDRRGRRARVRLHAAARQGTGRRPHRRGRARTASRCAPSSSSASTTGTSSRGCGASTATRASRSPGRTRSASARRADTRGENMRTISTFTVTEGERVPFVLTWFPSHGDPPAEIDAEQALRRHGRVLAGMGRRLHCRASGRWRHVRRPVAHRAQGAHLRADRRHRRRADDVAAGVDRRRAQLGLPLLLAARRDAHAARAPPRRTTPDEAAAWRTWLLRAVAGDPGRHPDHVRRRRRAAPDRARAAVASRLRRARARSASATPRASSSRSTSTAR